MSAKALNKNDTKFEVTIDSINVSFYAIIKAKRL